MCFSELEDCYGKKQDYFLDLILPPQPAERLRPVVFLVHGGGFVQPCARRQFYIPIFARSLTQQGYAVVSPDYPIYDTPEDRDRAAGARLYEKPAQAVLCAYEFICAHADELHLDVGRVAIMGGSAGAMTAFYAVYGRPGVFRALVNLWGAPKPVPELKGFPPVFSVHGTADHLVPFEREQALHQSLQAAGIPNRLVTMEGCDHAPVREDELARYLPELLAFLHEALAGT